MVTGIKTKLDYGDYCAIPTDGNRYELLDGQVHVTPAPSPMHQRLVLQLARALQDYFRPPAEVFVSPIDVILTPHDVVQPDLVVVANPAQVSERGIEGPPLLAIEVLSPATTVYDRTTKSQRYAVLGIPHYWIVDPTTRRLECYRREGSVYHPVTSAGPGETLTHPDFPAVQVPLAPLWQ
ncbi:MAG: Uma2 family endonuclease [Deltaproteobacteria bacterium]|nr:Uma2 family endonuclease [Deltaproteobacteria bacterium]